MEPRASERALGEPTVKGTEWASKLACGPKAAWFYELSFSHAHLLTCLWLIASYSSTREQLSQRPNVSQSLKYLLSGPVQKKFANHE